LTLELENVRKVFRSRRGDVVSLDKVSFEVADGEFVCILGPSGCGKSTVLNLIAGLEKPDSGEVRVNGVTVAGPARDRGMIFQEAALFPWLNVQDNVAFGLSLDGMGRAERLTRAQHYLDLVHLSGFEKAHAHELSGGMKQRVALARALAIDPSVLLMDEPFAALDAQTRDTLHTELQAIFAKSKKTVVFVTHNVREALVLGDRVLLMSSRPGTVRKEFRFDHPRPRQIEDHAVVDLARTILADLRAHHAFSGPPRREAP
jgi:NitT/TauT family transport system ATP-binding protein